MMRAVTVTIKVPAWFLWAAIFLGLVILGLSFVVGFTWLWAFAPLAVLYALLIFMYTILALASVVMRP